MRNFRKAGFAAATALAVTFGSASVALAEEVKPITTEVTETKGEGGSSTDLGKSLDAWRIEDGKTVKTGADAEALFGSSKEGQDGQTWETQPRWAQLLYVGSIFLGVSALVSLIVGPAYNFVIHGPLGV
ncbi:hypothetical protein [Corynebacterium mayonis]|uniref:hypothetical protein n=1 Tax=Corynebacterium mayonis TaxID=3062461 RepID=UPI003140C8C5